MTESLGRHALFADLSPDALAEFVALTREETYPEGDWVIRQGDENSALHVILEGEAGFVVGDEELMKLHEGMYFGEVSTLLGEPVAASVFARTPLRCAIVERDDLVKFLLNNPSVTYRLLQAEARRLADAVRWHA